MEIRAGIKGLAVSFLRPLLLIMESSPLQKKDWVLTQTAFDKLLRQLDPNRERAGQRYEEIRQKLTKLFKWRGCALPEEYTDRTIDRVARRIDEGTQIHARDPYLYFHGVALNVLREHWKEAEREVESLADLPTPQTAAENPVAMKERELERMESEQRLECLDQCVRSLSPPNIELITQYHQGEGGAKIERRRELARRLKIPLNALRIRAYRIRGELEACVGDCLKQATAG
jgi:DNA-directed RNA polymerase specialized sigma24 family protein